MAEKWVEFYAFNLIINSVLSFFTTLGLTQLLIFIFKIHHPRLKIFMGMLPILKLSLDPFLYNFQDWAILQWINPLEVAEGRRMFSLGLSFADGIPFSTIQLRIFDHLTFTMADILALSLEAMILNGILIGVGAISCVSVSRFAYKNFQASAHFKKSVARPSMHQRPIFNARLKDKLIKNRIEIFTSDRVIIPCAYGIIKKKIFLPLNLADTLSQTQYEAILGHELDHLVWYDGIWRFIGYLICHLFWWVPTSRWMNHLEQTQEIACDASILKLDMHSLDLASGILDSLRQAKHDSPLMVSHLQGDRFLSKRFARMMEAPLMEKKKLSKCNICMIGVLSFGIFFSRFWIF